MAARVTMVAIRPEADLPAGFGDLRDDARREGYTHIERLAADWASGTNRFAGQGEALVAAFMAARLAGVGGVTLDPIDPAALRMRRFYVRPHCRGQGIGRLMAEALLVHARDVTQSIVLNATTEIAVLFWEALGFLPDRRDGHTHTLRLSAG
ncbi:MAG TPA: GNAT family N-acetyltransferase [Acetobacteraceae bacterium]|nr:GNAT family N-acetyltransferase [Acetobacteraceae bacterium]